MGPEPGCRSKQRLNGQTMERKVLLCQCLKACSIPTRHIGKAGQNLPHLGLKLLLQKG
jgi:hypothetical protein